MRQRVLLLLILIFFTAFPVFAQENLNSSYYGEVEADIPEVVLEVPADDEDGYETPNSLFINSSAVAPKTLKEKLHDVYNLEVEKYDTPDYLFKEIFTHKYSENSFMDYTHFWAGYNGNLDIDFTEGNGTSVDYDFNAITAAIDGSSKNDTLYFRLMTRFMPKSHRNVMQTIFSDVYIGTEKIPHHKVQIGNFRPKVGHEGTMSTYTLPFITRAQISREFGTVRKLGAKIEGDYSFIDYNFGLYSSGTFFQEFFPGAEFDGWINIKPLAKTDGKYGKLVIGGGIQGGRRDNNYFVTGIHTGWEYKRLRADFEWAKANGYNGNSGISTRRHAEGFYASIGYMITKKLQFLVRFDQFDPDKRVAHNNKREYSAGINYFIKGQALRLMLNYVYCQKDASKDSHRIMIGTQIIL